MAGRIADSTGGGVYFAREPSDLLRIYTSIVSDITGREATTGGPLNVADAVSVPVPVAAQIEALTITVVKSDASVSVLLRDPEGHLLDEEVFARTSTGLVETLTVSDPVAGTWHVELVGEGQAYVSTVLRPSAPLAMPGDGANAEGVVALGGADGEDSSSGGSPPLLPIAIGVAMLGAAALGVVAVRKATAYAQARWPRGILAVALRPADTIDLAEVARRHRTLWLLQRPMELQDLAGQLGVHLETDALLRFEDGHPVVAFRTLDEEPNTIEPVSGRPFMVDGIPFVFATEIGELPRLSTELAGLSSDLGAAAGSAPDAVETAFGGTRVDELGVPEEADQGERLFALTTDREVLSDGAVPVAAAGQNSPALKEELW